MERQLDSTANNRLLLDTSEAQSYLTSDFSNVYQGAIALGFFNY